MRRLVAIDPCGRGSRSIRGRALAVALAVVALGGCSDLDFFGREDLPLPPPPVQIENLVFHRYQADNIEIQRVEGRTARFIGEMYRERIEFDEVRAFFYQADPNCQTATLSADRAVLYIDTGQTTATVYQQNDIDFFGNVTVLSRRGTRLLTDAMRYDNLGELLRSDSLTTAVSLSKSGAMRLVYPGGAAYLLNDNLVTQEGTGSLETVQDADDGSLRESVEREIAAVDWSCAPDDSPIPDEKR